jgi:flagellar biogenesis protein FliO
MPQERFLQHFISRSLVETPQGNPNLASPQEAAPVKEAAPLFKEALPTAPQYATPWISTATTMLLALGAILGCFVGGAHLLRRYFFTSNPSRKPSGALRVLSRAYLTPKTTVALLEIPGKLLVVGVTGGTLVSLGEVVVESTAQASVVSEAGAPAFATALDESMQELPVSTPPPAAVLKVPTPPAAAAEAPPAQEPEDKTLLQWSAHIQRKLSTLKQL